ncbi:MAG: lipoyl synthase [Candidatus Porifericomitaceae bacterium WSBS_2022_MAG_OTU9]
MDRINTQRGERKMLGLPQAIRPVAAPIGKKPPWIRSRAPVGKRVMELKQLLRKQRLHTVCEEANCPNLGECFNNGTATFMILGSLCTRRCPFCDVAHGRPLPPDAQEPQHLAATVSSMQLRYVVVTSVDRDDLPDRGASHFAACIGAVRQAVPGIKVEILTPDFKKREQEALQILAAEPPDVFNHNLETVPQLYRNCRPAASYQGSLSLLRQARRTFGKVPTKSGLMLGLGESIAQVREVLQDLREHDCDMLTLGQYLQPGPHHLPVQRYVTPAEFSELGEYAKSLGFSNVASGPMVRSSYHADLQAGGILA